MLIQASKLYTPIIFEAFQYEYERSMAACTTPLEDKNEYPVTIGSLDENFTLKKEYKVTSDPQTKQAHATVASLIESEYCVLML